MIQHGLGDDGTLIEETYVQACRIELHRICKQSHSEGTPQKVVRRSTGWSESIT